MPVKIALIHSALDPAGCNIAVHLAPRVGAKGRDGEECRWAGHTLRFMTAPGRLIYEEDLDERAKADLIIFLSRHTSKNPVPVLTVHVTGNYGDAALGGKPRTLSRAAHLRGCMRHYVLSFPAPLRDFVSPMK